MCIVKLMHILFCFIDFSRYSYTLLDDNINKHNFVIDIFLLLLRITIITSIITFIGLIIFIGFHP